MPLTSIQTAEMINSEKITHSELDIINSPSNVSIWAMQKNVWAAAASFISTLFDLRNAEAQGIAESAPVGIPAWIRKVVLEFQTGYSLAVVDFKASYPLIDPYAQIITRCSVEETGNRVIVVKVAKSFVPEPLSGAEKIELEGYLHKIRFAGTEIKVISEFPDKVYVAGSISYLGEYASVITSNVSAALNKHYTILSSASNFNGMINLNSIIDAVKSAEGVVDFIPSELAIRADSVAFEDRTQVYSLSDSINNGQIASKSGYVVEETAPGYDLASSLTFSVA